MKCATITIRLDAELRTMPDRESRRRGVSRNEVAREALRRRLRLLETDALRSRVAPFAKAAGFHTDEDIFARVS